MTFIDLLSQERHLGFRLSRYGVKGSNHDPRLPTGFPARMIEGGVPRYSRICMRDRSLRGQVIAYPTRNFARVRYWPDCLLLDDLLCQEADWR